MKKQILLGCGLATVLMLSSCATFFSGSKNTVTLFMEPAATSAAPAKIYIDGDFVESHHEGMPMPLFELSCKRHKFKVIAEGYAVWEKELIVLKGNPHRFVALLQKEQVK